MNHSQILKRAWNILWSYKTLWIFGIIVALTSASGRGGNNSSYRMNDGGSGGSGLSLPGLDQFNQNMDQLGTYFSTPQVERVIIPVVITFICIAVLVSIFFFIARLVSKVALVRMVDGYETSGEKVNWREGVRMGWSRAAWRLFLINLLIFIPGFLAILALLGCAALPVLLSMLGRQEPTAPGIVATIGLAFLFIFAIILLVTVISLVIEMIHRVCILENQGVLDSIRQGWALVRRNFKNVGLMWLILFGIRLALGILMIPVFLLLFGVSLLAVLAAGAAVYYAAQAAGITAALVIAIVIGVVLFFVILGLPLLFVGGLRETYFSTTWTLVYREIRPLLTAVDPEPDLSLA